MYKPIRDLESAIARRFEKTLYHEVAFELLGGESAWPWSVSLGQVKTSELTGNALQVSAYISRLRSWCGSNRLGLECEVRRFGVAQEMPARLVVDSVDTAAGVLGSQPLLTLNILRERAQKLLSTQGISSGARHNAGLVSSVLKKSKDWSEVDFDLLLAAAAWFTQNDATGLTPRQVPLEGFHAKWLDAEGRRALVAQLSGRDELGLINRPAELSFAYLDPAWLESGRRYDSLVLGDSSCPAYDPRFVLVVENKDSYLWFPQIKGGICVFGSGKAGPTLLSRVEWVRFCPQVLYWGDMDADGLEILNAYREAGLEVRSILMDLESFKKYERFGTRSGTGKRRLSEHVRAEVPHLADGERELYELLLDPAWKGALRVEQERIPLNAALSAVWRAV